MPSREIIAGVLFVAAAVYWWWQNRTPIAIDSTADNSDQLPPDGFSVHVEKILTAAGAAPAETQVEYLRKGLTVAETLTREVARLTEGSK